MNADKTQIKFRALSAFIRVHLRPKFFVALFFAVTLHAEQADWIWTARYVITEDDYIDFLVRMGSSTPIPSMIQEAFIDRHFLFLGYGLTDWNFRVMLGALKEHLKKQRSWAIRWKGSLVEEAIWGSRGVLMYDMKVEEFGDVLGPL